MPVLRLFAAAREAAGEARTDIEGGTVGEVLAAARQRYGEPFTTVLSRCRVWVNGQPADDATVLQGHDVVAVLPPVSGGAGAASAPPPSLGSVPPPPVPPPPRLAPSPPPPVSTPTWLVPAAPEPIEPPPPPVLDAPAVGAWSEPTAPAEADWPSAPSPPPSPAESFEDLDEAAWPPPSPIREWSWSDDEGRAPLPPIEGASPDELLDRLAGLAPRVLGEDAVAEPPPPSPPPPSEEETGAWPAPPPPPSPAYDEEDPDALWGPPSGPVWSLGEAEPYEGPEPYVAPEPAASGWEEDVPPAPGERTDARQTEDLPRPPAAPRTQQPPDWDRRWDAPQDRRGGGGTTEARFDAPAGAPARGIVQPTLRILGPEPVLRPASSVEVAGQPAVSVLGDAPPEARPNGSPAPAPGAPADAEPRARLALVGDDVRPPAPGNGRVGTDVGVDGDRAAARAGAGPAPAPAAEAEPAPATKPRPKPPPLAVVPKSTRPHGRLGFLWVGVTLAALLAGVAPVGVWLALCAGIAGLQTARVWRARGEKPLVPLAAGTAAALPVCAIWGIRELTAAVVVAVVVTLLTRLFSITKAPARDVGLTLAIGVVIGLAVAPVVLLRNLDKQAPLFLLAFAAAYDAGAYLVGTGASSAWEGPAAGVASLIPVTMLAAVVLVPPFTEGSPLLLGVVAAALAPCGPLVGSALLGERDAEASALRRLDSLLVMAPVWSWIAAAFLR